MNKFLRRENRWWKVGKRLKSTPRGEKMKAIESEFEHKLDRSKPHLIRLDGHGWSKWFGCDYNHYFFHSLKLAK